MSGRGETLKFFRRINEYKRIAYGRNMLPYGEKSLYLLSYIVEMCHHSDSRSCPVGGQIFHFDNTTYY